MDARSYAPLIEPIEGAGRIALRLEAEDWLIAGNMEHQMAEDCVRSKRKPDTGVEPNDLRVPIPAGVADIAISARRSARCRIVRFCRYRGNPLSLPFAVAEPHPCGGKAHERAAVRLVGSGTAHDYIHDGYSHWPEEEHGLMKLLSNVESRWPQNKVDIPGLVEQMVTENKPWYLNLRRE